MNKNTITILLIALVSIFCSCNRNAPTPDSSEYLEEFHNTYDTTNCQQLSTDLAIYVDYSTCIYNAVHKIGGETDFYTDFIDKITNETKHYYSIKGPSIREENIDSLGGTYEALKSVTEINYADIKSAAEKIAKGNTEAILLTDGEYILDPKECANNTDRFNKDQPYLEDAFKMWLQKGHDIFIYSEPYTETNHGIQYGKKRFYFIFTDTREAGNIYDAKIKHIDMKELPGIYFYHLTGHIPMLQTISNDNASVPFKYLATVTGYGNFEIQDWTWDWKTINDNVVKAVDSISGETLEYGLPIFSGLHLDKVMNNSCFKIISIKADVNDLNEAYYKFVTEKDNEQLHSELEKLPIVSNFVWLDKDTFDKSADIQIHFDSPNFSTYFLDDKPYNYFKIDIKTDDISDVFSKDSMVKNYFTFQSMDNGDKNNSVVRSIQNVVSNEDVQAKLKGQTLYTIYVKSGENNIKNSTKPIIILVIILVAVSAGALYVLRTKRE